jgi:hypothetical protein
MTTWKPTTESPNTTPGISTTTIVTTTPTTINTTTILPTKKTGSDAVVIGTSIFGAIVVLIVVLLVFNYAYRWCQRRWQLQRDLAPYYSYEQSEADVTDGILYSSEHNSADLLCVVSDHHDNNGGDNDVSFGNTNYFSDNDSEGLLRSGETRDFSNSVSV